MTCALMTPWWRDRAASSDDGDVTGSAAPTAILDTGARDVTRLAGLAARSAGGDERELVRATHRWLVEHVRPVYGVEERTRASVVLARRRGSCSQRLAVLEAVARANGISTRVRGLEVEGSFWYPRFPGLRMAVPRTVVVAWPELRVDGDWVAVDELLTSQGSDTQPPFTNTGPETLFDAAARVRIDWIGCTDGHACTLSGQVRRDLGLFESRDDLFDRHGQTLHLLARRALDPVLGRWSPAA